MWEGRCLAETLKGERCAKRSLEAYWVHSFQGEKFDSATWVETCETHAFEALVGGMVAALDIRHHTKA
jgi:hypothetical protein